jgi:hypothetical protein
MGRDKFRANLSADALRALAYFSAGREIIVDCLAERGTQPLNTVGMEPHTIPDAGDFSDENIVRVIEIHTRRISAA